MGKLQIRPYNHETDYEGVRAVLKEAGMFDEDYESPDQMKRYAAEHPDNVIVAARGTEVIGSIYLQDSDIIPMINRLAVKETKRRRGIGARLVKAAEATAEVHGNTYLEVYVDIDNEVAQSFWESQGYEAGHMYQNRSKKLE